MASNLSCPRDSPKEPPASTTPRMSAAAWPSRLWLGITDLVYSTCHFASLLSQQAMTKTSSSFTMVSPNFGTKAIVWQYNIERHRHVDIYSIQRYTKEWHVKNPQKKTSKNPSFFLVLGRVKALWLIILGQRNGKLALLHLRLGNGAVSLMRRGKGRPFLDKVQCRSSLRSDRLPGKES